MIYATGNVTNILIVTKSEKKHEQCDIQLKKKWIFITALIISGNTWNKNKGANDQISCLYWNHTGVWTCNPWTDNNITVYPCQQLIFKIRSQMSKFAHWPKNSFQNDGTWKIMKCNRKIYLWIT